MFKAPALSAFAVVLIAAANAAAQTPIASSAKPRWEFTVNSGTVVPTGAQRGAIKRANVSVAQLWYVIHPAFALTASAGWARTRDLGSVGSPKLDMFTYDVGAEVRANRWLSSKTVSLSPFAGVGAGGRSYNYRSLHVDATHNFAGYASAGGELGIGQRLKLRLEARDYVSGFKPLVGAGSADTRNDVSVLVGLRVKVR
jgi:hypothetical protein